MYFITYIEQVNKKPVVRNTTMTSDLGKAQSSVRAWEDQSPAHKGTIEKMDE